MTMKKITKSVSIAAPKDKVWSVLTTRDQYRKWASVFSPDGSGDVETDWQEGSRVAFTDGQGSGMVGIVSTHVPNEVIAFTYTGEIGPEGETSDSVFKDGVERYSVAEQDGGTLLSIESDMTEEYFDMMSQAWDKALVAIKDLAEAA